MIRYAAVIAICISTLPAFGQEAGRTRFPGIPSVSAIGEASERVVEDRLTISIRLTASGKDVKDVVPVLSAQANGLIEALRSINMPDQALSSDGPYMRDVYAIVRDENGREIAHERKRTGVEATYDLSIHLDSVEKARSVLKVTTDAGAHVRSVYFYVSNEAEILDRLRLSAAKAALAKARAISEAIGARPGRVLTIGDPDTRGVEDGHADLALPRAGPSEISFPILPGKRTISAKMEVLLELIQP